MRNEESTSKGRVLVAEDEEVLVDLLCRSLSDLLVEVAMDGREAWRKLREGKYDLVIADYNLSGMHGQDLLERMMAKGIAVPTIILSGLPLPDEALRALKGRQHSVLLKPLRPRKVREHVDHMLDTRRKRPAKLE